MYHVMFDVDGTLVKSYDLDSTLFCESVNEVTGITLSANWEQYRHVTDSGILLEVFERYRVSDRKISENNIKKVFLDKLKQSIAIQPIQEVPGAKAFLLRLQSMHNVVISIATGGWHESAAIKLKSAGIDIGSIPISSSNEHISRVGIMRCAQSKISNGKVYPCAYFGDGGWDKKACEELGFNFVLVGNQVKHFQRIKSFQSSDEALSYIGI